MWLISTEANFSAAHQLRGYHGECSEVHGHNFRVKVTVETPELKDLGIGIDFRELKQMLQDVLEKFDHRNLNELPEFKTINPSAENIAKVIWDNLTTKLKSQKSDRGMLQRAPTDMLRLKEVQVWESDTNSASYYE